MDNTIILLAGHSGAGKTSLAEYLYKEYGLRQVASFTDRPCRYEGEGGHIFISPEDFDRIRRDEMVAYTEFAGHRYCATRGQIDNCDLYVIDKKGIEEFLKNYHGEKRVIVVFLRVSNRERRRRMLMRGDSVQTVEERIAHDDVAFRDIGSLADVTIIAGNASIEAIGDRLYYYFTSGDVGDAEEPRLLVKQGIDGVA